MARYSERNVTRSGDSTLAPWRRSLPRLAVKRPVVFGQAIELHPAWPVLGKFGFGLLSRGDVANGRDLPRTISPLIYQPQRASGLVMCSSSWMMRRTLV